MFEVRALKEFECDTVLARTATKAEADAIAAEFVKAGEAGELFLTFDELVVEELDLFVSTIEEWSF